MRSGLRHAALAAACASALVLAACGKHVASNAPITFAPADTPYLFANFKAAPEDVRQAWNPDQSGSFQQGIKQLGHAASVLGDKNPKVAKVLEAMQAELANVHSPKELAQTVGLSSSALSAIYGIGDVPVARVELASPETFKAFWARVEKRSGVVMPTATVDKQAYWVLGGDDAKVHVLVAVQDKQLVATIAPADAGPDMLKRLLGLAKPGKDASDRLARLNSEHGYGDYGSGYLDLPKLFANLFDGNDTVTRAFAKELGGSLDNPACAGEFASLAAQAPLVSGGFQNYSAKELHYSIDVKLAPSLLGALTALKQPVPGMDAASNDAIVDMVMALPLQKWQAFIQERAKAAAAKAYQCPALQSLNEFASTAANPPVQMPPEAASLLGFRVVLDKLEAGPQVAGRVLVASSNPAALAQRIQQTLPQFALKTIPTDGKPVAFDIPASLQAMLGGSSQGWIAANSGAIVAGLGEGEETKLADTLNSPAGDGTRLMRMHLDGKIYGVMASWFGRFAAMAPAESRAQMQNTVNVFQQMSKIVASADVDVKLDGKGLHIEGTTTHR